MASRLGTPQFKGYFLEVRFLVEICRINYKSTSQKTLSTAFRMRNAEGAGQSFTGKKTGCRVCAMWSARRVSLWRTQCWHCIRRVSPWINSSSQGSRRAIPEGQIPLLRAAADLCPNSVCKGESPICVIVLPNCSSGVSSHRNSHGAVYCNRS